MGISLSDKKSEWLSEIRAKIGFDTYDNAFRAKIIRSFCLHDLGLNDSEFNGDDHIGTYFPTSNIEHGADCAIIYRDEDASDSSDESEPTSRLACCIVFSCFAAPSDTVFKSNLLRLLRSSLVINPRDNVLLESSYMKTHFGISAEITKNVSSVRLLIATCDPLTPLQDQALHDVIEEEGKNRIGEKFTVGSYSLNDVLDSDDPDIAIVASLKVESQIEDGRLRFALCNIRSLFEFMEAYRVKRGVADISNLYEKNVRGFLSGRGTINKGIARTLTDEPQNFSLYNNGLTIVADDAKISGRNELVLVNPFIVNGCQTSNVIYRTFKEAKGKKGRKSRRMDLSLTAVPHPESEASQVFTAGDAWANDRAKILVKIVSISRGEDQLCTKIVRFSNSQNAVKEKDFIALNEQFREWHDALLKERDLYLEIQKGRWESYKTSHPKTTVDMISVTDLLKIYASAWLRKAGTAMSRNIDFGPKGKIFEQVISLEPAVNEDDLYAAYLLKQEAQRLGFGNKHGKPDDPRRLTRYLFYLICGDLVRQSFNDWSDRSYKFVTQVFLELGSSKNERRRDAFYNAADQIVQKYFGRSSTNSVESEVAFKDASRDPNKFLKSSSLASREQVEKYRLYFQLLEFYHSEARIGQLLESVVPGWLDRAG